MSLIIYNHFQFQNNHIQTEYIQNSRIVKIKAKITKKCLAKLCISLSQISQLTLLLADNSCKMLTILHLLKEHSHLMKISL
jgi:hypothetical protein